MNSCNKIGALVAALIVVAATILPEVALAHEKLSTNNSQDCSLLENAPKYTALILRRLAQKSQIIEGSTKVKFVGFVEIIDAGKHSFLPVDFSELQVSVDIPGQHNFVVLRGVCSTVKLYAINFGGYLRDYIDVSEESFEVSFVYRNSTLTCSINPNERREKYHAAYRCFKPSPTRFSCEGGNLGAVKVSLFVADFEYDNDFYNQQKNTDEC